MESGVNQGRDRGVSRMLNTAAPASPFAPLRITDRSPLSVSEMLDALLMAFYNQYAYTSQMSGGAEAIVELALQQNNTVTQIARTLAAASKFDITLSEKYSAEVLLPKMLGEMSLHSRRLTKSLKLSLYGTLQYELTYHAMVSVFTTVRRLMATQKAFGTRSGARLRAQTAPEAASSAAAASGLESGADAKDESAAAFQADRPFYAGSSFAQTESGTNTDQATAMNEAASAETAPEDSCQAESSQPRLVNRQGQLISELISTDHYAEFLSQPELRLSLSP